MGDSLQHILDRMGEIIHRINAPGISGAVVPGPVDPVDNRVAHIEIAGGQIDFSPQRHFSILELPGSHSAEQLQAFLLRAVPIRAYRRMGQISPVFPHLFGSQLAHIGQPFFNQAAGKLVHFLKVLGGIVKPVVPVKPQPMDILLYSVHVLHVFLGRIGVVHSQIADSAKLFRRAKVDADSLGVADVQIAVRLRRKTGVNLLSLKLSSRLQILHNIVLYKIRWGFFPFRWLYNFRHEAYSLLIVWQGPGAGAAGFPHGPGFLKFQSRPPA